MWILCIWTKKSSYAQMMHDAQQAIHKPLIATQLNVPLLSIPCTPSCQAFEFSLPWWYVHELDKYSKAYTFSKSVALSTGLLSTDSDLWKSIKIDVYPPKDIYCNKHGMISIPIFTVQTIKWADRLWIDVFMFWNQLASFSSSELKCKLEACALRLLTQKTDRQQSGSLFFNFYQIYFQMNCEMSKKMAL